MGTTYYKIPLIGHKINRVDFSKISNSFYITILDHIRNFCKMCVPRTRTSSYVPMDTSNKRRCRIRVSICVIVRCYFASLHFSNTYRREIIQVGARIILESSNSYRSKFFDGARRNKWTCKEITHAIYTYEMIFFFSGSTKS